MREFHDLAEFATHLAHMELQVAHAEHKALERAAVVIEKRAQAKIGHYQDASGPFQDWAPLADSTEADKAKHGYPSDAPLLRTGELQKSIEHEVEGSEAVIGSKLDVAAYQEFGTPTIPPRPFIGPAAFESKEKIQQILGEAVVDGLFGGQRIHESLGYDMDIKP